jgi:small conductance mechanosensitive channel
VQHWYDNHWFDTGVTIVVVIAIAIVAHIAVRRAVHHLMVLSARRVAERVSAEQEAAARVTGTTVTMPIVPADVPTPAPGTKRHGRHRPPPPGSLAGGRGIQRAATLYQSIGVLVDVVLVIVVLLTILDQLDISVRPLLASAGIAGVALGFGAQSLVKDILSGIFIVIEDQYGIGDTITVGPMNMPLAGTVQAIGLRVTRLQDATGQIFYVRNGEISTLGNRTQGWSLGQVALPLPLAADPIAVLTTLRATAAGLDADPIWRGQLMEAPTVLGLTAFDAYTATYTVQLKCPATKQGDVERELRARALRALQDAGIPLTIPAPHR